MKVISTNIAQPKTILFQGREEQTGIFKTPTSSSILLEEEDVKGDHVIDRRYHGGKLQACYLYSADWYTYWKEKYPHLVWNWGMFGENITVKDLDERELVIGAEYQLGTAKVKITHPRQPCYKLGIRFDDQDIIRQFNATTYSGTYLEVLENGEVRSGYEMRLITAPKNTITIADVFQLMFHSPIDMKLAQKALELENLIPGCKDKIRRKYMRQLV